jgi:hypothetical protein
MGAAVFLIRNWYFEAFSFLDWAQSWAFPQKKGSKNRKQIKRMGQLEYNIRDAVKGQRYPEGLRRQQTFAGAKSGLV